MISNFMLLSLIAVNKSELIYFIFSPTSFIIAFFLAISNAISYTSKDMILEFSMYFAKLIVIAPEPVPISNILTSFFFSTYFNYFFY